MVQPFASWWASVWNFCITRLPQSSRVASNISSAIDDISCHYKQSIVLSTTAVPSHSNITSFWFLAHVEQRETKGSRLVEFYDFDITGKKAVLLCDAVYQTSFGQSATGVHLRFARRWVTLQGRSGGRYHVTTLFYQHLISYITTSVFL